MSKSPAPPDGVLLFSRIGNLWLAFIKGHLLLALIIGGLTWVVGSAIGLPGALWLGVVAGMLEPIPSVGPLVASIPAIVVAAWKGSSVLPVPRWGFALIVAGVYILIQQVTSLLLEPQVMGKKLNLPPLAVFAAVLLGAAVANVAGAYLAVPLLVAAREIVRYAVRKARGLPPFPEEGNVPKA
jgi:predicted PurR-regulated permease PerM